MQAALATIQRQNGEAVVVDGYKAMYDRLALERSRLVERAVELEYENKRLCARAAELEAEAAEARQRLHSVSQVPDYCSRASPPSRVSSLRTTVSRGYLADTPATEGVERLCTVANACSPHPGCDFPFVVKHHAVADAGVEGY